MTVALGVSQFRHYGHFNTCPCILLSVPGVLWCSRFLSALQTALTQLLLVIVSTGYGINRPFLSRLLIVFPAILAVLVFVTNFALMVVEDEHLRVSAQTIPFPVKSLISFTD